MNRIWSFMFLSLCCGVISAQQLTPFVISSTGGFYAKDFGLLSFTVGEMAAVETYQTSEGVLTQGFQQATDFGTFIIEQSIPRLSFRIYPNPSGNQFNILTDAEINLFVHVKISDMLGQVLMQSEYQTSGLRHAQPFQIALPSGMYVITLDIIESNTNRIHNVSRNLQIVN